MDQGGDDSVQEHAKKPVWWHLLVIPALGTWRQEGPQGLLASQFGELGKSPGSVRGAISKKSQPWWGTPLIQGLGRHSLKGFQEFKANLVYRVSSSLARATEWKLYLK